MYKKELIKKMKLLLLGGFCFSISPAFAVNYNVNAGENIILNNNNNYDNVYVAGNSSLTAISGAAITSKDVQIGSNSDLAVLTITGEGTTWTADGGIWVGQNWINGGATGNAQINIQDGAQVSSKTFDVYALANRTANFLIDGKNTNLTISDRFKIWAGGTSIVTISNEANVSIGYLAISSKGNSALYIKSGGKLNGSTGGSSIGSDTGNTLLSVDGVGSKYVVRGDSVGVGSLEIYASESSSSLVSVTMVGR